MFNFDDVDEILTKYGHNTISDINPTRYSKARRFLAEDAVYNFDYSISDVTYVDYLVDDLVECLDFFDRNFHLSLNVGCGRWSAPDLFDIREELMKKYPNLENAYISDIIICYLADVIDRFEWSIYNYTYYRED